ncbi:hypothetical protein PILCRDRAFT_85730 [Piloderma croceum F 1598]|uniref:Uncharacterized protein n=1 Tax=Piloderma croceum (strain F 1598) TaxID=765440 RepID=A0A0C3G853_PILCF|nr:hypothetical protein PILCRDRAFT_85730 [Piloderma croceum F 1598]
MLRKQGMFEMSLADMVKNKMSAISAYFKDPDSASGAQIASLLNKISEYQTTAATQSDEEKEESHVIGGEAIRDSSMHTLQHQCKHAASPYSDSDEENQPPTEEQPIKKTRHSLAMADSSSSSGFTSLKEMLQELEHHQEAVNKEMVETLWENTRVYERTSDKYLEVLMHLAHN